MICIDGIFMISFWNYSIVVFPSTLDLNNIVNLQNALNVDIPFENMYPSSTSFGT